MRPTAQPEPKAAEQLAAIAIVEGLVAHLPYQVPYCADVANGLKALRLYVGRRERNRLIGAAFDKGLRTNDIDLEQLTHEHIGALIRDAVDTAGAVITDREELDHG
ncbi:hypothetical protein [Nocardia brasiliensis]|uniref:hypothetical protein n=1 Tax=Nocardia brasiliensis TaxID=37326 RepID=UPI002456C80C|nr:hypothetical protein [Nocardia brasiliensis]